MSDHEQSHRLLEELVKLVATKTKLQGRDLLRLQRLFPRSRSHAQPFYTKAQLRASFLEHQNDFSLTPAQSASILQLLQVKPVRTWSGVATVTLLTKPWTCPGQCIFCPADVRMPKSYLANEPGAARAEANYFDPWLQVISRLSSLRAMGHNLDKVEIIILGGSWDSYPLPYRRWFINEIFMALNNFGTPSEALITKQRQQFYQDLNFTSEPKITANTDENLATLSSWQERLNLGEISYNDFVQACYLQTKRGQTLAVKQQATWEQLAASQRTNETATCRNVGLVIETRPDLITTTSLTNNRRFGCTKIQLGVQTLDDQVLQANKRGLTVAQIAAAFALIRQFGFKIHAHMMANLYQATLILDRSAYQDLVADERFIPDEIKLYPCSLLESASLINYYRAQQWQPYTQEQLLTLLASCVAMTPRYTRITRMIRDFSANDIVAGNKKTNFRQLVDQRLQEQETPVVEIRTREIKKNTVEADDLQLQTTHYQTSTSEEQFLEFVTSHDQIVGFLRLSLPREHNTAMIREVHVYGEAETLGVLGQAQHLGLGKKLIAQAELIAGKAGYRHLRVISAVGTRGYYRARGFTDDDLYQSKSLTTS